MNPEQEQKLIDLANKITILDRKIRQQRSEKGKEDESLREQFNQIVKEVRNILLDSGPIDDIR